MTPVLDGIALLAALVTYRRQIVPRVHEERRRWEATAEAIPDPGLRGAALAALREKGLNAEATAVFAILAPRARRAAALRAMTALQTAIDYLDTLGEQPVEDPLANGLALHGALEQALLPGTPEEAPSAGGDPTGTAPPGDAAEWYRLHPQGEDGGYLAALVATCRQELTALPARDAVLPAARRATRRCGEGQSHTHAALEDGGERLRAWAERQPSPPGYLWWEVAAGASSSVAAHALIAAAADPRTSAEEAEPIDAAYFPPVGALTVLLDDLIDLEDDRAAGEHNYMTCYPSAAVAADRLSFLASRARSATAKLRRRHRHAAIVAGVAGFYLSFPRARSDYASPIRSRLLESMGGTARLALAATRIRRRDR